MGRRTHVSKADDTEETPDGKELIELTVDEVSLVGKPAIKRQFSLTKQEGEPTKPKKQPKKKEDETPATISKEVAKAVAPLMTQLAEERLGLMVDVLKGIGESLSAGTLTSDTAYKQFSIIYSMLWKAESEVTALADALSLPKMEVVEKHEESVNKSALKKLMKSLKEEEDADMGITPSAATETKKSEETVGHPGGQEQIVKAVTDAVGPAVTAAITPLETRIAKLEAAATPAVPAATEVAKSEKSAVDTDAVVKTIEATISKSLAPILKSIEDVEKRIGTIEGSSGVGENGTKPPSESKTKSDKDDLWSGVV